MVDVLVLRVKMIKDNICIAGMASCKHYHLEILRQIHQNLLSMGSDVDSSFDHLSVWKCYWQFNIVCSIQWLVAVNQSLIQIENHCFFIFVPFSPEKLNLLVANLLFWRLVKSRKIGHDLQRCLQMLSSNRLKIFISSHDFRHIVDVVPGGIRVIWKSVQLLPFRYFGHQIIQSHYWFFPVVLLLLFRQDLFLFLVLLLLYFLLFFLLDVLLHFGYFMFQEVQLIMKF